LEGGGWKVLIEISRFGSCQREKIPQNNEGENLIFKKIMMLLTRVVVKIVIMAHSGYGKRNYDPKILSFYD